MLIQNYVMCTGLAKEMIHETHMLLKCGTESETKQKTRNITC